MVTTDGKSIEVLDFGQYNKESGPDFFHAKVNIGGTLWAGNVEMHVLSSDWIRHQHHHDKSYDNVILHVVYEDDAPVTLKNALTPIPVLELKGKIPKSFLDNYQFLMNSQDRIPCQNWVKNIDTSKINLWKYALTVERLHRKSLSVNEILNKNNGHWEETLYIILARYFGAKSNTIPFEMMAQNTPYSLVLKNKDKTSSLEALFFGQAGMLYADYKEDYFQKMKNEYTFLQKKYDLTPIDPVLWKFGRLRPVNFPTIRIAQFTGLLQKGSFLFSGIREAQTYDDIWKLLQSETNPYWDTHYRFGKESVFQSKSLSPAFADILIINAIVPVLYLYGKMTGQERYTDKAIDLLEDTKGEQNHITQMWKSLGADVRTAFDTQALIELKTRYCQEFKCLSCTIGHEILGKP